MVVFAWFALPARTNRRRGHRRAWSAGRERTRRRRLPHQAMPVLIVLKAPRRLRGAGPCRAAHATQASLGRTGASVGLAGRGHTRAMSGTGHVLHVGPARHHRREARPCRRVKSSAVRDRSGLTAGLARYVQRGSTGRRWGARTWEHVLGVAQANRHHRQGVRR